MTKRRIEKAMQDIQERAGLLNARLVNAPDFLNSPLGQRNAIPTSSVSWSGMQSVRYDWPKWETISNPDEPRIPNRRITFGGQVAIISGAAADACASRWIDFMLKPPPTDKAMVEAAIAVLYHNLRVKQPTIHWFDNPIDAVRAVGNIVTPRVLVDNLPNGSDFSANFRTFCNAIVSSLQNNKTLNFQSAHAISPETLRRVILYDIAREFGLSVPEKFQALITLVARTGLVIPLENDVYVSKAPVAVSFDNRQRLHHDTKAAIEYPDGNGFYFWHNVNVPAHVITRPDTIQISEIEAEQNAEVRRVMIEKYGAGRWIVDTGAHEVASDDYGAILIKEMGRWEEPIVVIRVRNSTPEGLWVPTGQMETISCIIDGEEGSFTRPVMQFVPELRDGKPYYKDYYLRVDPNAYGGKTRSIPQAAVASTWRDSQGNMLFGDYRDYKLDKQT